MAKLLDPREEVKKAIAARIRGGRQRFRQIKATEVSIEKEASAGN